MFRYLLCLAASRPRQNCQSPTRVSNATLFHRASVDDGLCFAGNSWEHQKGWWFTGWGTPWPQISTVSTCEASVLWDEGDKLLDLHTKRWIFVGVSTFYTVAPPYKSKATIFNLIFKKTLSVVDLSEEMVWTAHLWAFIFKLQTNHSFKHRRVPQMTYHQSSPSCLKELSVAGNRNVYPITLLHLVVPNGKPLIQLPLLVSELLDKVRIEHWAR